MRTVDARFPPTTWLATLLGAGMAAGLGPAVARAAPVELRNDDFSSGDVVAFQGGFVSGEVAGVRLDPTGLDCPCRLTKVRLLFGAGSGNRFMTITIWDDAAESLAPGAQLGTKDVELTSSDSAFQEVDFSLDAIDVDGPFRVGIGFNHSGVPSIGRDTDGTIDMNRNFIREQTLGWVPSASLLVEGDWIIRAEVDEPGDPPMMDAGVPAMDAGVDAGSPGSVIDGGTTGDGPTCRLNSDCPNGQYCGDTDVCTFDCRIDGDCDPGDVCDSFGRCVPPTPEASGSGSGGCSTGGAPATNGLAMLASLLAVGRRRARRGRRRSVSGDPA